MCVRLVRTVYALPPRQFMMSIKTVLIEMLSSFEAKGRMGSKQLKEQLHQAWPVPDSRVALEQLRKELRDELRQSLEVVSVLSSTRVMKFSLPLSLPSEDPPLYLVVFDYLEVHMCCLQLSNHADLIPKDSLLTYTVV